MATSGNLASRCFRPRSSSLSSASGNLASSSPDLCLMVDPVHEVVCHQARPAGVLNVLLTCQNVVHVAWQRPTRAEQIDLEHQQIVIAGMVQKVLQWRIGDETAIPKIVGADPDHWQRGRQGAARHDVLGQDCRLCVIEIDKIAVEHIHGTRRIAHGARIEQVKVHQAQQRLAQRRVAVDAGCRFGAARAEPRVRYIGLEEPGLPQHRGEHRRPRIPKLARVVAIRGDQPDVARGDRLPEIPQAFQSTLRRVAGDDRRIDATNGHAGNPVRLKSSLVQALVYSCLIGAQRATALQHERVSVDAVRPPALRPCSDRRNRACVHHCSSVLVPTGKPVFNHA